jgi:hypothetical protein
MSDAFWSHLPATILALASFVTVVVGLINGRKITRQSQEIQAIHQATNGMKDALLMATEKEALARGTAHGLVEGAQQERDRTGR